MNFLQTKDHQEIYFGDSGKGNPILFLSGFMGITEIWDGVIADLSKDFRCTAHDRLGYGPLIKASFRG
ncbi:MAG: hypothetical protein MR902_01180 [Campylobacter sp.]|nr:hypothetical protein [Campylobacter sp.]